MAASMHPCNQNQNRQHRATRNSCKTLDLPKFKEKTTTLRALLLKALLFIGVAVKTTSHCTHLCIRYKCFEFLKNSIKKYLRKKSHLFVFPSHLNAKACSAMETCFWAVYAAVFGIVRKKWSISNILPDSLKWPKKNGRTVPQVCIYVFILRTLPTLSH